MTITSITHHVTGQGGKYVAHVEGEEAQGTLEWEPGAERDGKEVRIATHTIVPKPIEGRGIAGELVKRLIADAREQDFLLDPQCSYVDAQFNRHSDWRDLRA